MRKEYLDVFFLRSQPSLGLCFRGERDREELLNGAILAGDEKVGRLTEGVACFVERRVNWPPDKIEKLRESRQIPRNWEGALKNVPQQRHRDRCCSELAAIEGIIMELATGPGGGNMPPILDRNPQARIIVNDVSPDILLLWRRFLTDNDLRPNVCLAAFDAREMPIRSDRLAAVSSVAGFTEIDESQRAIEEVHRVLQPGGRLFAIEGIVDSRDWARLPAERRAAWEETTPGLLEGGADLIEQAGFCIESRQTVGSRELDPQQDGDVAGEAAQYGVQLHVRFGYVTARKLR